MREDIVYSRDELVALFQEVSVPDVLAAKNELQLMITQQSQVPGAVVPLDGGLEKKMTQKQRKLTKKAPKPRLERKLLSRAPVRRTSITEQEQPAKPRANVHQLQPDDTEAVFEEDLWDLPTGNKIVELDQLLLDVNFGTHAKPEPKPESKPEPKMEDESAAMWEYKDPSNVVHGPYPTGQIKKWLPHFPATTPIRCVGDNAWGKLSDKFGKKEESKPEPTPEPKADPVPQPKPAQRKPAPATAPAQPAAPVKTPKPKLAPQAPPQAPQTLAPQPQPQQPMPQSPLRPDPRMAPADWQAPGRLGPMGPEMFPQGQMMPRMPYPGMQPVGPDGRPMVFPPYPGMMPMPVPNPTGSAPVTPGQQPAQPMPMPSPGRDGQPQWPQYMPREPGPRPAQPQAGGAPAPWLMPNRPAPRGLGEIMQQDVAQKQAAPAPQQHVPSGWGKPAAAPKPKTLRQIFEEQATQNRKTSARPTASAPLTPIRGGWASVPTAQSLGAIMSEQSDGGFGSPLQYRGVTKAKAQRKM
ncbi:hypothetical protein J8273_5702 [Carpediemonas membranifera]|uniref:GYF domain-containing protein n=1 Tax=Carpediemonas membranifera TaxID=201153 RepID=A0A8J6E969_9EUKA|nr:hypothetical protein J8273_5702 [Carpediemonas membranifera]|eukprot:KAG9392890.1 hypothetical protein J8273_5702 [Carpediemonas membranifera]